MAVGTIAGNAYTPGNSTGFADNVSSGLTAPFSMDDTKVADKTTVVYTAAIYALLGFIVAKVL